MFSLGYAWTSAPETNVFVDSACGRMFGVPPVVNEYSVVSEVRICSCLRFCWNTISLSILLQDVEITIVCPEMQCNFSMDVECSCLGPSQDLGPNHFRIFICFSVSCQVMRSTTWHTGTKLDFYFLSPFMKLKSEFCPCRSILHFCVTLQFIVGIFCQEYSINGDICVKKGFEMKTSQWTASFTL